VILFVLIPYGKTPGHLIFVFQQLLSKCENKPYEPFNDEQIEKQLNGIHLAGIYPLLQDNS